jgi:sec-independent protein translocase protein TatB
MFDVAPTELLLVAIVALLVIGPKDLPKAMRFVGHWVGKARGVARQFRSGFDSMVREAELAEMEKKWAEENARIMREHPADSSIAVPAGLPAPDDDDVVPHHLARDPGFGSAEADVADAPPPVTVEALVVAPADASATDIETKDKAPS